MLCCDAAWTKLGRAPAHGASTGGFAGTGGGFYGGSSGGSDGGGSSGGGGGSAW